MTARCRSCNAEIMWARTEKGRRMPLDPEPYTGDSPSGQFVLRERGQGTPLAVAVPPLVYEDEPHYVSHFSTCSHPERHRKPR